MRRRGKAQVLSILLTLGLAFGAYLLYTFGDYYITLFKMKELTKSVMLDWVGLNEGKARRRLGEEFRRQEIPEYISPDYCEFQTVGNERSVTCSWEVDVYYPGTDYYKTLSFEAWAMHDGVALSSN